MCEEHRYIITDMDVMLGVDIISCADDTVLVSVTNMLNCMSAVYTMYGKGADDISVDMPNGASVILYGDSVVNMLDWMEDLFRDSEVIAERHDVFDDEAE